MFLKSLQHYNSEKLHLISVNTGCAKKNIAILIALGIFFFFFQKSRHSSTFLRKSSRAKLGEDPKRWEKVGIVGKVGPS